MCLKKQCDNCILITCSEIPKEYYKLSVCKVWESKICMLLTIWILSIPRWFAYIREVRARKEHSIHTILTSSKWLIEVNGSQNALALKFGGVERAFWYKFIYRGGVPCSTAIQSQLHMNPTPALYRGCLFSYPARRDTEFTNKKMKACRNGVLFRLQMVEAQVSSFPRVGLKPESQWLHGPIFESSPTLQSAPTLYVYSGTPKLRFS